MAAAALTSVNRAAGREDHEGRHGQQAPTAELVSLLKLSEPIRQEHGSLGCEMQSQIFQFFEVGRQNGIAIVCGDTSDQKVKKRQIFRRLVFRQACE